jgi:predicted nucleic-acid-binding Zn-ribbon protein
MPNIIPKGYFECPKCKNPWMRKAGEWVVLSSDKSKIIRVKTTYVCEKCSDTQFTIEEPVDNG